MCWNRDSSQLRCNKIVSLIRFQSRNRPKSQWAQDLVNPKIDRSHFFITYSLVWILRQPPNPRSLFQHENSTPWLPWPDSKQTHVCKMFNFPLSYKIQSQFIVSLTSCLFCLLKIRGNICYHGLLYCQEIVQYTPSDSTRPNIKMT